MAETCSSNNSNGCSACGPSLSVWSIVESATPPVQGFGCLNGDPLEDQFEVYKSKFTEMTESSTSSNDSSNFWDHHKFNSSSNSSINSSQIYEYIISPYGSILVGLRSSSNSRYQAAGGGGGSVTPFEGGPVVYCGLFSLNASNTNYFNRTLQIACDSDTGNEYLINIDSGESRTINAGCGGWCFRGQCSPDCDTACQDPGIYNESTDPGSFTSASAEIVSCTEAISSIQSDNSSQIAACMENCPPSCCNVDYLDGQRMTATSSDSNASMSLSGLTNKDFFYGLAKQSVDTKTGISKENKPRNCKEDLCGSGGKDDCWGTGGNLYLPSKPTAIKALIKIAAPKEEFDKEYKSVSGKGIFYIPSEEDIEEGRTPCCNDDFSGTVVKEQGYGISAGPTFKEDYYAADGGEVTNESLEDEQLSYCYTIDNISFLD